MNNGGWVVKSFDRRITALIIGSIIVCLLVAAGLYAWIVSIKPLDTQLRQQLYIEIMIVQITVTSMLAGCLIVGLRHMISKPIKHLMRAAEQLIAEQNLQPLNIATNYELTYLAYSLNALAQQASQAQHENTTNLQRERAILATVSEGVLVCDAEGHIIVMNTAAYDIIGRAEANRLHKAAERGSNQYHFYAALEALQPFFEHALGKTSKPRTSYLELAERSYNVHARPIWVAQQRIGAVVCLQDMSATIAGERLKNEYITIASHELRTPLTSIGTIVELFQASNTSQFSAQQHMLLESLGRSNQQLNELLNDMLDLAKLDQPGPSHQPQMVDLGERIRLALDLMQPEWSQKAQRVYHTNPEQKLVLWLDPLQLDRILSNVLSNATKYTPEGGTIWIQSEQRQNDVLIQIKDNGIGIPYADQHRIFGRFFRVENPLSRSVGGTGLGLAITKSLIELNHGSIYFESAPNQGTTFYLSFPLALACSDIQRMHTEAA